jgi:hypothetical protein
MESLGKAIVGVGVILIIVGLVIWFLGGRFGWFGSLPGDLRIEGGNFRVYVPIASMIILSIVLSIVLSLIARFFR